MTPFEQQLYYNQLKQEVAFYKGEVAMKDWWYATRIAIAFVAVFVVTSFLFRVLIKSVSFSQWVDSYEWIELPIKIVAVALVYYFWKVRRLKKRLYQKTKDLHQFLLNNPSLEKTTA